MIKLHNVSHEFSDQNNSVTVLDEITLTITNGEHICVVGESGSGKSTLMNILGLMLKPSSGNYHFDGVCIKDISLAELSTLRNKSIGMVFQDFHLIPNMTAEENVALPLFYGGVARTPAFNIARNALKEVGLHNRLTHKPRQLSGGQRQRVAIARAMVNKPRLLVADEPTGALDHKTGEQILTLFTELGGAHEMSMVIVTHDRQVASRFSTQLMLSNQTLHPL